MKKFCLLTTGRAGSTALIDVLSSFDNITVPNKQVDCPDNELLHPLHIKKYAAQFSKLSGNKVTTKESLVNAFYSCSTHLDFAGFKSMPKWHFDFNKFTRQSDIQFITLVRNDIATTVASFIIASEFGTWRRYGGKQNNSFTFDESYEEKALQFLLYILEAQDLLTQIDSAIHLEYEKIMAPGYSNEILDNYFQRKINIKKPVKAISYLSYVRNSKSFTEFINRHIDEYKSKSAG